MKNIKFLGAPLQFEEGAACPKQISFQIENSGNLALSKPIPCNKHVEFDSLVEVNRRAFKNEFLKNKLCFKENEKGVVFNNILISTEVGGNYRTHILTPFDDKQVLSGNNSFPWGNGIEFRFDTEMTLPICPNASVVLKTTLVIPVSVDLCQPYAKNPSTHVAMWAWLSGAYLTNGTAAVDVFFSKNDDEVAAELSKLRLALGIDLLENSPSELVNKNVYKVHDEKFSENFRDMFLFMKNIKIEGYFITQILDDQVSP